MMKQKPANLFTLPPGRVHVMGICGVGAAGVAWMLHLRGWQVSGCDQHILPTIQKFFARHGIAILQDHAEHHLEGVDALVYSAAIHADEPELVAARKAGKIVLSRGECLAGWVSGLRSVAVCGTHGKTTSSCFVTRLLQCIGEEPLWCIGGYTPKLLTNAGPRHGVHAGNLPPDQIAVAEADESDGTLAYEHPAVLLMTNIDMDHLDHFRDAAEIEQCFATVAEQTREGIAVCADAPRALRVAATASRGPILTYGFSPEAKLRASQLQRTAEGSTFRLDYGQEALGEVHLTVPGDHNVLNALGAMAACMLLGFDPKVLVQALPQACAELPKRRFQWLTPTNAPVRVVIDYAHHPAEIQAMLSMARLQKPKRMRVVFQPHRYSRTQRLLPEFVHAFAEVDELMLLPVYAASESPDMGCESYTLYAEMRKRYPEQRLMLARSTAEVTHYLQNTAAEGDLILIVGAGDVVRVGDALSATPRLPAPNLSYERLRKVLKDSLPMEEHAPLAPLTWYRIGGSVDVLATVTELPQLVELSILTHAQGIPMQVMGAGANRWFSDFGLHGVLCRLKGPLFTGYTREGDKVVVGSGMVGAELLHRLEEDGLSGLEFLQGVPGCVGGWAFMNAGAQGHAFWEVVDHMRAVTSDGQLRHITPQMVNAGYRSVRGLQGLTIISVTLRLTPASPEAIRQARSDYAKKRLPLEGMHTCGSLFKNPAGNFAGAVLDHAGAKGLSIGGAYIADFHANILAAREGCTASDILALMLTLKALARPIDLVPEVRGFDD